MLQHLARILVDEEADLGTGDRSASVGYLVGRGLGI